MLTIETPFTIPLMRKASEAEKKIGVSAKIGPKLFDQLKTLASADDRTVSYVIEKAIHEFVAKHTDKPHRAKRQ